MSVAVLPEIRVQYACARRISFRFAIDRLVCRKQTRPALAPHARSLRDLGFGDHAATDAGENGDSVLGTLHARIADHRISRESETRESFEIVGGVGVLFARPESSKGRAAN